MSEAELYFDKLKRNCLQSYSTLGLWHRFFLVNFQFSSEQLFWRSRQTMSWDYYMLRSSLTKKPCLIKKYKEALLSCKFWYLQELERSDLEKIYRKLAEKCAYEGSFLKNLHPLQLLPPTIIQRKYSLWFPFPPKNEIGFEFSLLIKQRWGKMKWEYN